MDKKYKQASILAAILLIAGCGLSAVFTGNKKNNHNSSKNNLLKKVIFHKNEKNYLNTSTKQNNQSSDNDTSSDNNTSKGSNIPKKNEMADNYDIFRVETEFKKNIGNSYLPYLQVGGVRFFHVGDADLGGGGDLFIPIWQTHNKLFFTDARFYDRTGGVFEGNIHLGYRYLMPEEQRLYGVYAAFDRRRSGLGNYFNQLTLGGECWIKNWFIGGNVYKPIGKTSVTKSITENIQLRQNGIYRNIWFTSDLSYEKAIPGVDAEVGYEFVKGLVGYVGGYYFDDKDTNSVLGPKAKLTYDFSLNNSKKILGIFDKIGFETGIQNDKPRGTTWYISLNARLGLSAKNDSALQGVARHMVDLVRRDVDIVTRDASKKKNMLAVDTNGDPIQIKTAHNQAELEYATLKDHIIPDLDLVSYTNNTFDNVETHLILDDDFIVKSPDTGKIYEVPVAASDFKSKPSMPSLYKAEIERKAKICPRDIEIKAKGEMGSTGFMGKVTTVHRGHPIVGGPAAIAQPQVPAAVAQHQGIVGGPAAVAQQQGVGGTVTVAQQQGVGGTAAVAQQQDEEGLEDIRKLFEESPLASHHADAPTQVVADPVIGSDGGGGVSPATPVSGAGGGAAAATDDPIDIAVRSFKTHVVEASTSLGATFDPAIVMDIARQARVIIVKIDHNDYIAVADMRGKLDRMKERLDNVLYSNTSGTVKKQKTFKDRLISAFSYAVLSGKASPAAQAEIIHNFETAKTLTQSILDAASSKAGFKPGDFKIEDKSISISPAEEA